MAFIVIGYGPGLPQPCASSPSYALWKVTPSGITEVGDGLIRPPTINGADTLAVCQIQADGTLTEPYGPVGGVN